MWVGNAADDEYLAELRALASSCDVTFEPKIMVSDDEIRTLLNRATLMAYAPRLEPFGYAPLEANACGTPVVAVAEGGVRETVRNGRNGLLVEHDPHAIAAAIAKLIDDPELARRMGDAGRAWVQERFSLSAATDAYGETFAVARRGSPRLTGLMPENSSLPAVSIAILVRNGMPNLRLLLDSLTQQEGVDSVEIVAVDSGSTDGSLEALAAAGVRIHQIDVANFSFGPTRQLAFSLTRGRVIVTLSQDTMPTSKGWLRAMTEPISRDECDLVQSKETSPPELQLKLNVYNCSSAYSHWPSPYVDISCAGMAISRSAWVQTGFGDVVMSEDKYLAQQAMKLQLRVRIAEGVSLLHGHPYTPSALAKRAFNEGVGARRTGGYFPARFLVRDLFRPALYKNAVSAVIKYRAMTVREAAAFPLRPIFLYLGTHFGKRYWR